LFHSDIVERTTAQQDRFQRQLVVWRWVQAILERLAHALLFHTSTFCLLGGKAESIWDMRRLTATRLSSP
jgi:hypothetical protein